MLNYNQIPQAIENRQPFKGNSCKAIYEGNYYNIYSYSTLIYRENLSSKTKSFSYDYYSQTTSKLQNIISEVIYGVTIQQFRKEKQLQLEAEKNQKLIQAIKNKLSAEKVNPLDKKSSRQVLKNTVGNKQVIKAYNKFYDYIIN